jgi:hypothetical protein
MPSTYSSNLRLELQATGENTSTWGVRANNDFELIEDAIAGYVSVAMANANVTLSALNGAVDQSRNMFVQFTGANTAIRVVTIPSVSKMYFIGNSTTGGFDIQVKTAAGSAVGIPPSSWAVVLCDGTNCTTSFSNNVSFLSGQTGSYYQNLANATGTLAVANGGTGSTTAANARTALGLAIGTDVQAYDLLLSNMAALSTVADRMIYTTGVNTVALTAVTNFARTLLDDADAASARATLGIADSFVAGTKMLFQQTAAPTGWTKDVTHNNKALRVVSGTASSGGTVAFDTAFASKTVAGSINNVTVTGTVGNTSLSIANLPSHDHGASGLTFTGNALPGHSHNISIKSNANPGTTDATGNNGGGTSGNEPTDSVSAGTPSGSIGGTTASTGSGTAHGHSLTMDVHGHTFTGTAINLDVQYVDLIIATKN